MAERKNQSKYMPPDYDPRVLKALHKQEPKQKKKESAKKESVRVMLPFKICCTRCGSYLDRGSKFNGKKEVGVDADYLGTKVLRFHIKCDTCSNPIVFRTDPKTAGFVVVSGARENKTTAGAFNPLAGVEEKSDEKNAVGGLDAIEALEARAMETKREMEIVSELEREMQLSNARMAVANKSDLKKVLHEDVPSTEDLMEEEVELAAFRERKRALAMRSSNDTALGAALAVHGDQPDVLEVKKVIKKPKTASLVPYDDDDDD